MKIFNESAERLALGPVVCAADATVNGVTINHRGAPYFRDLTLVLVAGAITDGTHTLVVQDSPDGTTWTDVADTRMIGGVVNHAELAENTVTSVSYAGTQPYVRMAVASTGTTVGGVFAGIAIQSNPRHLPAR